MGKEDNIIQFPQERVPGRKRRIESSPEEQKEGEIISFPVRARPLDSNPNASALEQSILEFWKNENMADPEKQEEVVSRSFKLIEDLLGQKIEPHKRVRVRRVIDVFVAFAVGKGDSPATYLNELKQEFRKENMP